MESSLYFIIHHTPRSSQIELDLLSSPAHSGSKPCEICLRILITLCIPCKSKSNTHTHTHMQTCTDFLWLHYSSNESSVSLISPEFCAKVETIGVTPAPPKGTRENNSFWRFLLSCFFFCCCFFPSSAKFKLIALKIRLRMRALALCDVIYLSQWTQSQAHSTEKHIVYAEDWHSGGAA